MAFYDAAVWRMPVPVSDDLTPTQPEEEEHAFAWDYDEGDLLMDGAGNVVIISGEDAWQQWVSLAVMTTRAAYLAFDRLHGADLDVLRREGDPQRKEALARRTFTAAARQHPDTSAVTVELLSQDDNTMTLAVRARSVRGAEAEMEIVL